MAAYNGLSGGAGASDALWDIMTQRKMEQRQAFLDDLTRRDTESEIQNRQELTKQRAQQFQLERDMNLLKILDDSTDPGQDLGGLSPEMQDVARRYNRTQAVAPTVGTAEAVLNPEGQATQVLPETIRQGGNTMVPSTTAGPAHSIYTGGRARRDELARQAAFNTMMQDPNLTPEQKQRYKMIAAMGDFSKGMNVDVSDVFGAPLPANAPVDIFDEQHGTVKPAIVNGQPYMVPGGHHYTQNRPPIDPSAGWQYIGTNSEGKIVQQSGRNGTIRVVDVPGGGAIGPKPTAGRGGTSTGAAGIKANEISQLNAARKFYDSSKQHGGIWGEASPEAKAALWSSQEVILSHLTPNLKAVARGILSDPDAYKTPVQDLIAGVNPPLSPPDKAALEDALSAALGHYASPE